MANLYLLQDGAAAAAASGGGGGGAASPEVDGFHSPNALVLWSFVGDAKIAAATAASSTAPVGSALARHAPRGVLALRSTPDGFQVAASPGAAALGPGGVLRSKKD